RTAALLTLSHTRNETESAAAGWHPGARGGGGGQIRGWGGDGGGAEKVAAATGRTRWRPRGGGGAGDGGDRTGVELAAGTGRVRRRAASPDLATSSPDPAPPSPDLSSPAWEAGSPPSRQRPASTPTIVCSRVWRRGRKRPVVVWAQRWRRDPRERRGLRPARREDGGIGPCAATAQCSAATTAVPPQIRASRPDLEGGGLWWSATTVDLRRLATAVGNGGDGWLRQLAAATGQSRLCHFVGLAAAGPVLAFS
uniref:Uncharacterized protein n=1 Tax=Oryza meridionalis TaxID=40149 RepID=A0A0E0C0C2_9ORYZ